MTEVENLSQFACYSFGRNEGQPPLLNIAADAGAAFQLAALAEEWGKHGPAFILTTAKHAQRVFNNLPQFSPLNFDCLPQKFNLMAVANEHHPRIIIPIITKYLSSNIDTKVYWLEDFPNKTTPPNWWPYHEQNIPLKRVFAMTSASAEIHKQAAMRAGLDQNLVVVGGNLNFDELYDKVTGQLHANLGIPPSDRVIVVFGIPENDDPRPTPKSPNLNSFVLTQINAALAKIRYEDKIHVVYMRHPRGTETTIPLRARKNISVYFYPTEKSKSMGFNTASFSAWADAAAAISVRTTNEWKAALNQSIHGRHGGPSFIAHVPKQKNWNAPIRRDDTLVELGVTMLTSSSDDLARALTNFFKNSDQRQIVDIRRTLGWNHGPCAPTVVEEILKDF